MQQIKYFHTYETHTKQRWVKQPLIDVLASEFRTRSYEYYEEAIETGVIKVNDKIVHKEYKLKDLDIIKHTVHMHEPMSPKIEMIKEEDDFIVVNKPSGIPCHPTGGYFEYSVTRTLFKDKPVGCVNRLDMPVSGVLIITIRNSNEAHNSLKTADKVYIAKVNGKFPDSITVNESIGLVGPRIFDISKTGKECTTIFKLLSFNGTHSLVECRPITGRTHQIRIHIKHIGFPILNDILYGGYKIEDTCKDDHIKCNEDISMMEDNEKYKTILKYCKGTNNRSFLIKDSFICLHAWKYTFRDITYMSPIPEWAGISEFPRDGNDWTTD